MRLVQLTDTIRMVIEPTTNLKEAYQTYDPKKHFLNLEGEFDDEKFLKDFGTVFNAIEQLALSNYGTSSNDFVYTLPNLKTFSIGFYTDVEQVIDFERVNSLETLSMSWLPKRFKNLTTQTEIKKLHLTQYKLKNLKALNHFKNVKNFSILGGSLKNLEGIETFNNLETLNLIDVRSLIDISDLKFLNKINHIEFDSLYKLSDFSPLGHLSNLNHLRIEDSKKLESIQFVKKLKKLEYLNLNGTTIINDYDTTPAEHVTVFWGSRYSDKYNKHYPEKELHWVDGKWKKIAHLD